MLHEVPRRRIAGNSWGLINHKPENSNVEQQLEVEIENILLNITYSVIVDLGEGDMDFGSVVTNEFGSAEIKFKRFPEANEIQISNFLPVGRDVCDIWHIQIMLGSDFVFEVGS